MSGRAVAYDIHSSCLVEQIASLKGGRGVEIDFAGLTAGRAYRETLDLLLVAVVTLATRRADYLYLVGCQLCMANHLADERYAVHEKVQVEIDLLRYGVSA